MASVTIDLSNCPCCESASDQSSWSSGVDPCLQFFGFQVQDQGGGDALVSWDVQCCSDPGCGNLTVKIYRGGNLIHTEDEGTCAGFPNISGSYLDSPGSGTFTWTMEFITENCGNATDDFEQTIA